MTSKRAVWAVVTGASRGIGHATVEALLARGVNVALLERHNTPAIANTLSGSNAQTRVYELDLRELSQVELVGRQIATELAPAFLFNVAGIVQRASVADLSALSIQEQLAVNLVAPMLLTKTLLPSICAAERGAVVNVGSISSTLGSKDQAAYNASKWAIVGFTKCLALELSETRAHTVVVLPGAVDTSMLAGSPFPARMSAAEVASTLVHYALDASRAHNGAVIEMFGT